MQRKLRILVRRRLFLVVAFVFASLIVLALAVGFWRAEPAESRELVNLFPAQIATRTPGPTPTPPHPPSPPPLPFKWPPSNPTSVATVTPFPTGTPLPSVVPGRRGAHWAENLTFGPPELLGKDLKVSFQQIDWSPDGSRLAISLFTGDWIRNQAGKSQLDVTQITLVDRTGRPVASLAQGFDPRWSPDGVHIAHLAYVGTLDPLYVRAVNVQTKQVIEVAAVTKGGVFPILAWLSPSELAFYYKDQPMVFDLRSRQTRPLLDASLLAQIDNPALLRDLTAVPAKNILAVGSGGEILLLKWTNGSAQLIRRIAEGASNSHWALSPDGERLAYPIRWGVKIVGVYDQNVNIELPACLPSPFVGNWSPDGASLLFEGCDGSVIVNRDGSGLRSIPNVSGAGPPFWTPGGDRIAWVDLDRRPFSAAVTRLR